MSIVMPKLPYAANALEPVISEQTINYHYGKHLQGYVNTVQGLVKSTEYENMSVEDIVKTAPEGALYNNAGQLLNHTLYFSEFKSPVKDNHPTGKIAEAINRSFGSFEAFKSEFAKAATSIFGSGWAWLSEDASGRLVITKEANGGNPLRNGLNPVFGIDVWEHAYYLDYQNRRADHIAAIWDIVDWNVVESRLAK
ncbi:MAG: superoxide dismutase [Prevotella sp.]|nr:superoxide dismutase [Prevotella sp.]